MRSLARIAALLIVCGALALAWRLRAGSERASASAAPAAVRGAPSSGARAELVSAGSPIAAEVPRVAVADGDVEAAPVAPRVGVAGAQRESPSAPLPPEEVSIEGTVVVLDPLGVEHVAESGTMRIVCWSGDLPRSVRVEIRSGCFQAGVPADARFAFDELVLDGRPAFVIEGERATIPESRSLALRARWPAPSVLYVRAAESGADLEGVELVMRPRDATDEHPGRFGADDVLASAAASPIDLSSLAPRGAWRLREVFARAPARAWKRIQIDVAAGGERFLLLEPGGDLAVELVGAAPPDASLRLRRGFRPTCDVAIDGASSVAIEGLPVGRYFLTAEVGNSWEASAVLGEATVEIVAGALARERIELRGLPQVEKVALAGTIVLEGWEGCRPGLTLSRADRRDPPVRFLEGSLDPVEGRPAAFAFSAEVAIGRYLFEVDPPVHLEVHEIDRETDALEIRVPPPAIAAVRVVDRDGAVVPEVEELHWSPERPQGVTGGTLWTAERDPASGRFEIRAPAGRLAVVMVGIELRGAQKFDLAPGRHEVDLVVDRACGFRVVLRDGTVEVPWEDVDRIEVEQVEGDGRWNGRMNRNGKPCWTVTQPGLYRFTPPVIDGYLPPGEQTVLVPEQGIVEHVVELVRAG